MTQAYEFDIKIIHYYKLSELNNVVSGRQLQVNDVSFVQDCR